MPDIADLDREISEARAQRARLEEMANGGDLVAKLVVSRLEEAERQILATCAPNIFTGAPHA